MAIFPAARGRFDVGPADVGRRLTIRYRGEGWQREEHEVVGVLSRWSGGLSDGILRLRRRDGIEVGVRVADIVAARVVAPEYSAYAIQRLCQEGWPPLEQRELGNWTLRASCGATGRANSVRVAGQPPGSLRGALAEVERWYGERGLPAKLQLTRPSGLEDDLDAAEWGNLRHSRVMVSSASRLLNATSEARHRQDLDVAIADEPNSEFQHMISGYDRHTAREFEHAMNAVRPAAFVYCRNTVGDLLGIGHGVRHGDWCGMTTVQTTPQSRRRGIATAVTAKLAEWGRDANASHWYLQLFADNAAALGFYERLGFTTHHEYEYRWPGGQESSPVWLETDLSAETLGSGKHDISE